METQLVTRPDYSGLALRLADLHRDCERHRDTCIAASRLAIERAIAAGDLLLELREKLRGEFDDWLDAYRAGDDAFPCRATCYNYMKAVRFRAALDDDCPEFASLKELYIAAGILPPPPGSDDTHRPAAPLFRLALAVNGPPPEEWEPLQRRDFLQRAQPVVDLFNRVKAAEAAA